MVHLYSEALWLVGENELLTQRQFIFGFDGDKYCSVIQSKLYTYEEYFVRICLELPMGNLSFVKESSDTTIGLTN